MKIKLFLGHFLSLFFGGMIYILFRSSNLKMFKWFDKLGMNNVIDTLRINFMVLGENVPNWFKYSLPDGLWVFSYVCLLLMIWSDKKGKESLFFIFIIPLIAFFSELGQIVNIVPGTFDITDIIFYSLGTFAPFLLRFNLKTYNIFADLFRFNGVLSK